MKEFRDAIDFTMDFIGTKGLFCILSDVTEQRVVDPGGQEYVKMRVDEFIARHGRLRLAFLVAHNMIAGICVNRFSGLVQRSMDSEVVRQFTTYDDAVGLLNENRPL